MIGIKKVSKEHPQVVHQVMGTETPELFKNQLTCFYLLVTEGKLHISSSWECK